MGNSEEVSVNSETHSNYAAGCLYIQLLSLTSCVAACELHQSVCKLHKAIIDTERAWVTYLQLKNDGAGPVCVCKPTGLYH